MSISVVQGSSLRAAFGSALVELADPNKPNFLVVDCDTAAGTCTDKFRATYPDRFIQAGIAEQAGVCLAAGLALASDIPIFFTTFSAFMMRCYEQIVLSVCQNKANVKLVASHPGLSVGPDGSSAQCLWDLGAMRALPGLPVISPCDSWEMKQVVKALLEHPDLNKIPVYVRTGRSSTPDILSENYRFYPGKGAVVYPLDRNPRTSDVSLVSCGHTVAFCIEAAKILWEKGIEARVINMSTLKPIDTPLLIQLQKTSLHIFTVEDHNIFTGLYGAVAEALAPTGSPCFIHPIGVQDKFGESGEPPELFAKYGLDGAGIAKKVLEVIG